ncbi:helicase-exonuclease AddAB subunit AddB [Lederbergia sp. NSJ-179]|uniref:helicase-exonuclease AddAB subunit AddB n=1 Tax=Lederbergia sp. NSJ-179 TaxID=2931402 RepID=UPI001FD23D88|nr:helicase-exonuclease AddAB subunit AddB [Lederbergia sp. NSJ-179]MCJ7840388.1 helicase-exonuclease AddAB subunit AddB [Lederbergia sp. NSJ-179]
MSFRFVIGRSGSGKTTLFLNEMKEKLMNEPVGHPILYIVPEQMTFLSENQLIHTPGLSGMIRTQVYSLTRLAWRVLQETGGAGRNRISSTGINMLIRKIIEEHKDELKLFKKASDKAGFIQHLETMMTEFKHYCIEPEKLAEKKAEFAFGTSTRVLADKLHDLELLYKKFVQGLEGKYVGTDDYLNLLAESIEHSSYLRNAEIYIDGFHNFTPQEYRVIEKLMSHCKRVSIALMLDRPFKYGTMPDDLYLFRTTGETYSLLFEMARENGVQMEEDVFLYHSKRFEEDSLQHLQLQFEKRPHQPFNECPAIELKIATNRRAEMEGIAREIRRLVMEEGFRYKDIAILLRNEHDYQEMIETVFYDYEIPFFLDQKRTMLNHPLIELIRSSLEVISSHWRYEPVFRAVKTDLLFPQEPNLPTLREQMDRLENYCLANGIKGEQWTSPQKWTYKRYAGLELENVPQTESEKEIEAELNRSRLLVVQPLQRLSRRLKTAQNGRELCEAVYLFLEELDIPKKLEIRSIEAEKKGELNAAKEHDQAWDTVMGLLDEFVEILGEESFSVPKFISILEAGLEAAKFSLIPPALDQVSIANMEQSRLSSIKVAFVAGFNDGVLPTNFENEGVFSDEDRVKLEESGLKLAPNGKQLVLDEDFVAYRALVIARNRLYLSYPLANEEGKALLPSPYLKRIQALFPKMTTSYEVNEPTELELEEQFSYISHPTTAIAYLSRQLQMKKRQYPVADYWWDVFNFYMEHPQLKIKAKRILSSLFSRNKAKKLSDQTSRELYGEEILASVSRMELFHACPFSHFSTHGLRLHERDIFRLEAPHIGDLFHAALKWIATEIKHQHLEWGSLTNSECAKLAKEAVNQLAPKLFNQILLSTNRYFYIKRKLEQIIARATFILGQHAKSSGFNPVGVELGFGPFKDLPPLSFTLKNGTKMQLQGRIDRVDKAEDENGVYLRVIDYKSSSRALDLNEVLYGLSLQMLTYLDIVMTHAPLLIGTDATPAGVLYFHVHNPMVESEQSLTLDEIEKEILKKFKMKGLLLGDANVIQLMDTTLTSGTSEVVPAGIKKDGNLTSRSSAASREDFSALQHYVRQLYKKSGDRIMDGQVDISPYQFNDRTPCQFCAFKAVCQFDPSQGDNDYRHIPKRSVDDALAFIKEAAYENKHSN